MANLMDCGWTWLESLELTHSWLLSLIIDHQLLWVGARCNGCLSTK